GGPQGVLRVCGVKFGTAIEHARRVVAMMGWPTADQELPETPLPISQATQLLIDGDSAAEADPAWIASTLERTVAEESVQCAEDLIARRSNWGSTGRQPVAAEPFLR